MKTTTVRLYSLDYSNLKTYFAAALFILGNLVLPQLCHLVPQGGVTLLPIYFFTLIAAYKYGWKVGLLTAVFSPVLNHLLFGMPPAGVLPAILLKSILLALVAGYLAVLIMSPFPFSPWWFWLISLSGRWASGQW